MTAKVAIVGMGRMGSAMAARLVGSGFDVTLTNRTSETARSLANVLHCEWRESAAEAVAEVEFVISSLADDAAVMAAYTGPGGVVSGLPPGSTVLETSTVDPSTIAALRSAVAPTGANLVDAPVSGSVALVEAGALTIMAGGDPKVIEHAGPVLSALAGRVFSMGESGSGATMKLAVNALVHAINVAVSESLVMAERSGVDRSLAYDVFAAGAGGSPFVQYKRAAFLEPDTTPVAFSLDLVAKDLRLILGLADRVGAPMVQSAANLSLVQAAQQAGFGPADMSALASHLRGDV